MSFSKREGPRYKYSLRAWCDDKLVKLDFPSVGELNEDSSMFVTLLNEKKTNEKLDPASTAWLIIDNIGK
jgi:hypothetical protein